MIVNYGGEDVVIYGDYNADDNARSVYEVATLALQDSASYSANEIAILQGYVQTATPTGVEVVVSSKEIELWA
jgi:proteasome assembly chaperone (PAC2) family protein